MVSLLTPAPGPMRKEVIDEWFRSFLSSSLELISTFNNEKNFWLYLSIVSLFATIVIDPVPQRIAALDDNNDAPIQFFKDP
jgi:hypothetical protein